MAYAIGESTEHVSERTGPVVADLLNASFGNAPELLISLFAVSHGLFTVVRASLTGSVVSNLLLVLGTALVLRPRRPTVPAVQFRQPRPGRSGGGAVWPWPRRR